MRYPRARLTPATILIFSVVGNQGPLDSKKNAPPKKPTHATNPVVLCKLHVLYPLNPESQTLCPSWHLFPLMHPACNCNVSAEYSEALYKHLEHPLAAEIPGLKKRTSYIYIYEYIYREIYINIYIYMLGSYIPQKVNVSHSASKSPPSPGCALRSRCARSPQGPQDLASRWCS